MVDTEKEAANTNTSFFKLMHNPKRMLVEDGIFSCIRLCRAAGVARSMIADTLLKYALREVVPRGEITDAECTIWYAQLLRFRDQVDAKITEIENP